MHRRSRRFHLSLVDFNTSALCVCCHVAIHSFIHEISCCLLLVPRCHLISLKATSQFPCSPKGRTNIPFAPNTHGRIGAPPLPLIGLISPAKAPSMHLTWLVMTSEHLSPVRNSRHPLPISRLMRYEKEHVKTRTHHTHASQVEWCSAFVCGVIQMTPVILLSRQLLLAFTSHLIPLEMTTSLKQKNDLFHLMTPRVGKKKVEQKSG